MARELALGLLKKHKIDRPEVDVDSLARECGLTVVYVDVEGKLSGQLYVAEREIVINKRNRSRGRQRFTLAHELGHWQLRHHLQGELPADTLGYAGAFEDGGRGEGRSAMEIEANTFAAELLMPGPWIRRLSKPLDVDAPTRLAAEYGVSREAMFYQLMRCGRI